MAPPPALLEWASALRAASGAQRLCLRARTVASQELELGAPLPPGARGVELSAASYDGAGALLREVSAASPEALAALLGAGAPPAAALLLPAPPAAAPGELGEALAAAQARGLTFGAAIWEWEAGHAAWATADGAAGADALYQERLTARFETPHGAVVDGAHRADAAAPWALPALAERLALAARLAALPPGAATLPARPVVLAPKVAAPLVAGLSLYFRADLGAAAAAAAKMMGKQVFPSCLGVADSAAGGCVRRRVDDEGTPCADVALVEAGRWRGLLHTAATAKAQGAPPNGRGFRASPSSPLAAAPLGFHVLPGAGALPPDGVLLTTRYETFTTMPKAGRVSLLAAGFELEGGAPGRAVGPVTLELPVLPALRKLRAVGDDLTFFAAADGCGAPSLVFEAGLEAT